MRVLLRGALPLFARTWAEVSVLPRPGDVITIEDGEDPESGHAYTVAGVQFDLSPQERAGAGQEPGERCLREEAIIVRVRP